MNGLFLGNDRIMGIIFSRIYSFSSTFMYMMLFCSPKQQLEVKITIEFTYEVFILCLAVTSSFHTCINSSNPQASDETGLLKISQKYRRLNSDKPKVLELVRAELRGEHM